MKNKDLFYMVASLLGGIALAFALGSAENYVEEPEDIFKADTVFIKQDCGPEIVLNKKALLIGDSHSAFSKGWQSFLSQWTGLKITNTAVEGKPTSWMKRRLVENIDSSFKYC